MATLTKAQQKVIDWLRENGSRRIGQSLANDKYYTFSDLGVGLCIPAPTINVLIEGGFLVEVENTHNHFSKAWKLQNN